MSKLRELVTWYTDRIAVGITSLVAGIHIELPADHPLKDGRNRTSEAAASGRVRGVNLSVQSRRADSQGSNGGWHDDYYFVGSIESYRFLKEALQQAGSGYEGAYYRTGGDRFKRTAQAQ